MRLGDRAVLALALLGGGGALSYVVQRLIDAGSEPPIGSVMAQAHIPYYWRMAVALLHGLMLAGLSLGLPPRWRERVLHAAPVWVGGLSLAALIAMLAVP